MSQPPDQEPSPPQQKGSDMTHNNETDDRPTLLDRTPDGKDVYINSPQTWR